MREESKVDYILLSLIVVFNILLFFLVKWIFF